MPLQTIVLASSNAGKLKEFQRLLEPCRYRVLPQSDFSVPDIDETGLSFVENAILKARNACKVTGLPALADDSGLEVDALQGRPGIYSSRFAGINANSENNICKLLDELRAVPQALRGARFQCVLAFMRHAEDPTPLLCHGTWEGVILESPRGAGGFGYDPIFYVPSHDCSAAELSRDEKGSISHRAQASKFLLNALK